MSTPHPLRSYLEKHRLSMSAIAQAVGTSRQTIHRIENGQQEPSVALMRKLAEATNNEVPASEILAACLAPAQNVGAA